MMRLVFLNRVAFFVAILALLTACMQAAFAESPSQVSVQSHHLFPQQRFTKDDAILVTDNDGRVLYDWRADQAMIPASLIKLVTTYLSIEKWGLEHRFITDFYRVGNQLWVKGYGDPYLISEEITQIASKLKTAVVGIESIHLDNHYFHSEPVAGRSQVVDPYNAPLSAISANFNTAMLQRVDGRLVSAEEQTPLTQTAINLANDKAVGLVNNGKAERINLRNAVNSQQHFAEVLLNKLNLQSVDIYIDQRLPDGAVIIYRHQNSHSLQTVLAGAMKYSNNFIANHLFLKLAEVGSGHALSFDQARRYVKHQLTELLLWDKARWKKTAIEEGAGLSRVNKLTAQQIDELLVKLKPHYDVLKRYDLPKQSNAFAFAKTGTLHNVNNFAGFLTVDGEQYRFVFMLNRATPYQYRYRLLESLAQQISNKRN